MNNGLKALLVLAVVGVVTIFAGYSLVMDYNNAGQRHFVQTFDGSQKVVYEGGPFWYGNGLSEPYYNSLRTIKSPQNRACDYEAGDGYIVQYGDGGKGSICAVFDAQMSMDEGIFTKIHNKYRSEDGVRTKLLNPNYQSLFTTTAELFTSTEAYETKRSQILEAIQYQLKHGPYVTTIDQRDIVVGVDEEGKDIIQTKDFSVIARDEKTQQPLTQTNPFTTWDMEDIRVTITGYDFEAKTITQISNRRDATNRGETAQAEAKAAYWEGKKAEAEGEKGRIEAQARAEITNAKSIADAKRDAELAVIEATKQKDTAAELEQAAIARKAQAEADAESAVFEAQTMDIMSAATAQRDARMLEAQMPRLVLDAQVEVAAKNADAIARMNMPTNMWMNNGSAAGTPGQDEMQMLLQLQVHDKLEANAKNLGK